MARLFFPSAASTVTCRRCGNSVSTDADTCPHCGADHGGTFGARKTATFAAGLRLPFVARREAVGTPSPYPSLPEEAELAGTGEQRWDTTKTITLGAVMLALIAGGVIYSQYGENDATHPETPAGHSAYGAIDMKPARDTSAPAAGQVARQAPVTAAPSTAARDALPADTTIHTVPALPGTVDNLQAAREAIDRGDLTTARRRFSKIPAAQMYAANVQRTQAELTILERTRDGLLLAAHGCEATGSWLCVRQNARDVLAIDASNAEAQALVEHAITRSGWLNKPPATTAHAAPRPNATTPLASPTAPAFVAGSRAAAAPAPAPTPAPARRSAAVSVPAPATHMRPIPVMPAPAPAVVATKTAPVASDATRVDTGSHAPLTSSTYNAANSAPGFVPMPDGPAAMPNTAAPAVAHAPTPAEPAPSHAAATQAPGDASQTPLVRSPAPIIEAAPVRTVAVPQGAAATGTQDLPAPQASTRSSSPTATRTLASGDNAANGTQPKAPAYNAADTDAEERAILESGWKKSPSSKPRSPSQ